MSVKPPFWVATFHAQKLSGRSAQKGSSRQAQKERNFRSRHSHKVRNHCSWSREKHIFFLQNRFFNVFLIILCFPWYISYLVFFSSNLTQFRHFSEDFEIICTFQYILKQSDWKVSDHLEISGKFWKCLEYVKLVGNV